MSFLFLKHFVVKPFPQNKTDLRQYEQLNYDDSTQYALFDMKIKHMSKPHCSDPECLIGNVSSFFNYSVLAIDWM